MVWGRAEHLQDRALLQLGQVVPTVTVCFLPGGQANLHAPHATSQTPGSRGQPWTH